MAEGLGHLTTGRLFVFLSGPEGTASEQSRLSPYQPQGTGPWVRGPLALSVLEILLHLAVEASAKMHEHYREGTKTSFLWKKSNLEYILPACLNPKGSLETPVELGQRETAPGRDTWRQGTGEEALLAHLLESCNGPRDLTFLMLMVSEVTAVRKHLE